MEVVGHGVANDKNKADGVDDRCMWNATSVSCSLQIDYLDALRWYHGA